MITCFINFLKQCSVLEKQYIPTLFTSIFTMEKNSVSHTLYFHQRWGKTVYPTLFFSIIMMEKNSVPHTLYFHQRWGKTVYPTLFFSIRDGEKQCTLHSLLPSLRWRKTVYPTLFLPFITRRRATVYPLHSFTPSLMENQAK